MKRWNSNAAALFVLSTSQLHHGSTPFVLVDIVPRRLSQCPPLMTLQTQSIIELQNNENSTIESLGDVSEPEETSSSPFSVARLEQRNLRFSGVGRLYAASNSDENPAVDDHLQVLDRLQASSVIVVGLGGVGSWAAEALCRSGVGNLTLVDLDDVCISNTNRQLHALESTVGKMKIDVMKERLMQINPECNITLIHDFVSLNNVDAILQSPGRVTACLDAIDGSKAKTALIASCARWGIPIVTSGGSAGRTDPTKFACDDLTRVTRDRLLSSCRRNLRKFHGFDEGFSFRDEHGKIRKTLPRKWNVLAVYSTEPQKSLLGSGDDSSSLRRCDSALGTACFVTATSGFVAAGKIVDMIARDEFLIPRSFQGNRPEA